MNTPVMTIGDLARRTGVPAKVLRRHHDLGLIYGVETQSSGLVEITMTLTSVGCPVQDLIRADAEMAVGRLDGVNDVNVEFVWTPPWGPDKMTEDGKRQMRMFGFNV